MKKTEAKWKLVTDFAVNEYRCGLHSGDRVRLKSDIIVRDTRGKPTGTVHKKGEIWTVLHGSKDDPGVVRLLQADGRLHFWDDEATIFDQFDKT